MPFDMPTLHMICGLPGSGKSTLAAKLERELPALRFTPDEWIERMNEDGHKKGKRKLVEKLKGRLHERNQNLPANTFFVNPNFVDLWLQEFEAPTQDELG